MWRRTRGASRAASQAPARRAGASAQHRRRVRAVSTEARRVDTEKRQRVQFFGSMFHKQGSPGIAAALLVAAALILAVSSPAARGLQDRRRRPCARRKCARSGSRDRASRRPESITAMVRLAAGSGFNTLLVQVRGRGDAYYASRLEPRAEALTGQAAGFDPLALTVSLAHERGLRVHAWVNVNLVSSGSGPAERAHARHLPASRVADGAAAARLRALAHRHPQSRVPRPARPVDALGLDRGGRAVRLAGPPRRGRSPRAGRRGRRRELCARRRAPRLRALPVAGVRLQPGVARPPSGCRSTGSCRPPTSCATASATWRTSWARPTPSRHAGPTSAARG